MTEEQIKLVHSLQTRINIINEEYQSLIKRNKNYDGEKIQGNNIYINLYHRGSNPVKLATILSEEKQKPLLDLIINTIEAELELLIIERDSYILSKPV